VGEVEREHDDAGHGERFWRVTTAARPVAADLRPAVRADRRRSKRTKSVLLVIVHSRRIARDVAREVARGRTPALPIAVQT
jgi:hypothetical protein